MATGKESKADSLTHKDLLELLSYDPSSGKFTWLYRPIETFADSNHGKIWNSRFAGKLVPGSINTKGYLQFAIHGKRMLYHRIVWFYVHGNWPKNQIDHIDGDKVNNKIGNLREATNSQNQQNLRMHKKYGINTLLGASYHKRDKTFHARITINGKLFYLGRFATELDAHNRYVEEKRKIHPFGTI